MWKNYRICRKRPVLLFCVTLLPIAFPLVLRWMHANAKHIVYRHIESWLPDTPELCLKYEHRKTSAYCVNSKTQLWVYYTPKADVTRDVMASINEGLHNKIGNMLFARQNQNCTRGFCVSVLNLSYLVATQMCVATKLLRSKTDTH